MNFTDAFARYGATLRNVQWAVSAIADEQLVLSCWSHYFSPAREGIMIYEDRLSRSKGPGSNLLREHLEQAQKEDLPVRLVMARAEDTAAIDSGSDASAVKKTYTAREEVIGKVVEFDGDLFRVEFRQLNPRKPKVVKSRWSV
jgi:hypothetical protein